MTLEKKLVRLRKKEGMSQADVSEKLDVSRQAVSRWEAGDSRPSTENLQALCKLYRHTNITNSNAASGMRYLTVTAQDGSALDGTVRIRLASSADELANG